jgi:VWFA-related protein
MRRHALVALVPTVLAVLSLTVRAQQGQPPRVTFRGRADLIPVDVSVLDGNRQPVKGLTAGDFTVLVDGKPRPIVAFSAVELPGVERMEMAAPWVRDAPHDVIANDLPEEGRLVAILIDGTIPDGQPMLAARQIARAAVDELGPGDLAAVVRSTIFGNNGLSQGFTADRSRLLAAIDSPSMGNTTPPEMTANGLQSQSPVPGTFLYTKDQCEVIYDVARAMGDAPHRRKVLLFVGSNILLGGLLGSGPDIRECRDEMFRELDLSNVTVQSVDPVGLNTTSVSADYITHGPISPNLVPGWNQQNLRRLDNLRVLPAYTGGRLVANTNKPETFVPAIFAESQQYYLLGFEPASPTSRALHTIRVQVHRRGVTVHSRNAYLTEPPAAASASRPIGTSAGDAPAPDLAAALEGPVPRQDLPLSVNVTAFAMPVGRNAAVAVALGATFPAGDGPRRIAITAGAFDIRGRSVGMRSQTFEVPAALARLGHADDGLLARLELPPGRYELRVAARDEGSGAVGSVFSFVDVPGFSGAALTGSGLVLHHDHPPLVADNPLADIVPVVPTVARVLSPDDKVSAFLRLYQPGKAQAVSVTAHVIDGANRTVFEQRTDLAPEKFLARSADLDVPLPLSELVPGIYLLRIEALLGEVQLMREVRFEVSPKR